MASKGRPRAQLRKDEEAPASSRGKNEPLPDPIEHQSIKPGSGWNLIVAGILLLIVAVTYVNSFQSGWVLDNLYIIRSDPRMQATQWTTVSDHPGVREIFTQDYWWPKGISGLYRPITTFTYWMNYTLFGSKDDTTGFHWVNLLLHWINAVLLYFVGLRLLKRFWLALFAAGLFATHPIATESVTNIIGRADEFAALTVLGGLLLYMRFVQSKLASPARLLISAAMLGLALFGVFSKESALAIVLVMLLYDCVYRVPALWRAIEWREVALAVARAFTISAFTFFVACAFLFLLVPWLGQMNDISLPYLYSNVTIASVPQPGSLHLNDSNIPAATELSISETKADGKGLIEALSNRLENNQLDSRITITSASDPTQSVTYDASGTLSPIDTWQKLKLEPVHGSAQFKHGEGVLVSSPDPRLGWASLGIIVALVLALLVPVVLVKRNIVWTAPLVVTSTVLLLIMAGIYQPSAEDPTPGTDTLLVKLKLIPKPNPLWASAAPVAPTTQTITPLSNATGASTTSKREPNPTQVKIRHVVMSGLVISAAVLLAVEAYFAFGWREEDDEGELPLARARWRGFFDGYYGMAAVTIVLFVVRDWVFANTTPPEEPFLDNPIRGANFFDGRMTAIKVIGKLLWRLVWPHSLSADYSYNQVPIFLWPNSTAWENVKAVIALIVVVGLIVFAIWNWKRTRDLTFWILFFFIALLPTANLIIVIGSIMAERFIYLPLAGFCVAAVMLIDWALHKLIIDRKDPRPTGEGSAITFIPHAVFCAIMIAFGVRAAYRNLDWRSDETLFRAGVRECPNAFRNYQSLAFALYTEDARGNIKEIIDTAEKGLSILDDLPPRLNSSRLYLHLGMYYLTKAQTVMKVENNQQVLTDEAREWLKKAVAVMERGKIMDQAFNTMNHEKEIRRGKPESTIPNAGLPQLYQYLGDAYRALGDTSDAIAAYNYARDLDPREAEVYAKLAETYLQTGKQDAAVQKMIQLLILKPQQPQVWGVLAGILNRDGAHRVVTDPKTHQALFNSTDPEVKALILSADREFIEFLIATHRPQLAQSARDVAVNQHGFAPSLIDPQFEGTGITPTPAQ